MDKETLKISDITNNLEKEVERQLKGNHDPAAWCHICNIRNFIEDIRNELSELTEDRARQITDPIDN